MKALHTALVDQRHGYEVSIKEGDNANVVEMLRRRGPVVAGGKPKITKLRQLTE